MASKISWFGGHMARTVRELKDRLKLVDLVLEVRDARIPMSSNNPELNRLVQHKRRLVILNKSDLAAPDKQQAVQHALQLQGLLGVFTSTQKANSIRQLLKQAKSMLQEAKPNADVLMIMAIGVPNSGKSALINALRHAAKVNKLGSNSKAATGPTPGLTRCIAGFQVGERPTTYIMDTPGVMLPDVPNQQTGMRLALTGAIKDSIVGEEALVRHMLWELANQPQFAVPFQETPGQRKAHIKVKSIPAALTAAIESMKKTMPVTAALSDGQYDAAQSVANANTRKLANRDVSACEAQQRAVMPGQQAGLSQAAHAEASEHSAGDQDNADAAASASKIADDAKTLSIDTGLDALHHALKIDLSDVGKLNAVYRKLVDAYRTGKFGRYTLDDV